MQRQDRLIRPNRLCAGICLAVLAGTAQADLPDGWFPVGSGQSSYDTTIADDAGRDGPGLRIRNIEEVSGKFGGVGQAISAINYRGDRIAWSAQVRTLDVEGWSGLWMRVDSANGNVLAFDNMQSRPLKGTMDWDEYSVILNVPEEADTIVFGVLLAGEGEVTVDNMTFEVVEDDEPPTERDLPTAPRNLDF